MLNTVSDYRGGFTRREHKGAREAQQEMHLLGFLPEREFENMVRLSTIVNCPVTFDDELIFGPDITSLKGKSARRKPARIVTD